MKDKAPDTIKKLISSKSIHDKERYVTNSEYTFLWNPCFEFQNFDDQEISNAMNILSLKKIFTKDMIANNRQICNEGKRHNTLEDLFQEKTGVSLCKRDLSKILIGYLCQKVKNGEDPWRSERVFLKVFSGIIHIASWHSLPNSQEERDNSQKGCFR